HGDALCARKRRRAAPYDRSPSWGKSGGRRYCRGQNRLTGNGIDAARHPLGKGEVVSSILTGSTSVSHSAAKPVQPVAVLRDAHFWFGTMGRPIGHVRII